MTEPVDPDFDLVDEGKDAYKEIIILGGHVVDGTPEGDDETIRGE